MCWGHNVGAQGGHNVGAQSICGGIINLWGYNQFVFVGARHAVPPQIAAICCHSMPFYVILCHPMPCPTMLLPPCYHAAIPPPCYHAMTPPHALPLPFHATAAICCHPCPPMPCPTMLLPPCTIFPPCHTTPPCYHAMTHHMSCPQIQETHTMVGAQWWRLIEGIMWEHNVDTLWGYNGEAQCGGTMWRHNVGTM
jgi:hypothetical protein